MDLQHTKSGGSPVGVLHMIDTLEIGGAEQMAVSFANRLPRDRFLAHLCTTRREGPLSRAIAQDVPRLRLARRHRFDLSALRTLLNYVRSNDIRILHAHSSSLFMARMAAELLPRVRVIWHDHYNRVESGSRPVWLYRRVLRGISGVISVNTPLADWARTIAGVSPNRVWQVNNFAILTDSSTVPVDLPGSPGRRIVCVANLRPEKGHRDLLAAVATVRTRVPDLHLLLVGAAPDEAYQTLLAKDVERLRLTNNVSFLGKREDVSAILRNSSIGVLSSHNEAMPVALLEYGLAGIGVVATDAGECSKVLEYGRCGLVVSVGSADQLASALERLLTDTALRITFGARLKARIESHYGERMAVDQLCTIYENVVKSNQAATINKRQAFRRSRRTL
jgi:glycosyltransferase involved in cell wall biosynthesis